MAKTEKLEKIGEKAKLTMQAKKVEREYANRTQLNLKIDIDLKETLQRAYGRNLTALFEEMAVERLRKDGYLTNGVAKKAE